MSANAPTNTVQRSRVVDSIVAAAVFAATFLVFWYSPVHQVTDSNYSMLLSQCLITRHTFALDECGIPVLEPVPLNDYITNGGIYQLALVRNRVYYFFPVGSSVLSVPYVAAAKLFGISLTKPDGSFDPQAELAIEVSLAALLMALLTSLFFLIGRTILPVVWSVVLALSGALGTQIWSTASRGLWSHTWSALLGGVVILILLRAETSRRRLNPYLLATLLSWMYFVRPTNSVVVLGVTVFVFLFYRNSFLPFALTGAGWFVLFLYYSWHNFGHLFPNYYRPSRLLFDVFPKALVGNLISPSRGLFVFVPVLLFVGFLLWRYWKYRPLKNLTWLGLFIVIATLIIISGFAHWWGGASFGPRFTTDAVPWFVLLGAVAIAAMIKANEVSRAWSIGRLAELSAGALLLAASIFINARGAVALETWRWNPGDISQLGNKLWDWRRPQFLAGLVLPPLEHEIAPVVFGRPVDFSKAEESNQYLWYGWSGPEQRLRWTEGREATIVFKTETNNDLTLRMKVLPFIREGLLARQRIYLELNGKPIDALLLTENRDTDLVIQLPGNLLQNENILKFKLPDAASPELLKLSTDQRLLAFAVYWIEFERKP